LRGTLTFRRWWLFVEERTDEELGAGLSCAAVSRCVAVDNLSGSGSVGVAL
jgi:hypothetical protein